MSEAESMPEIYTKVVVNPSAGGFSVHREWPQISRRLQDVGLSFEYEFTEGSGHAMEIARHAVDSGYRYLIAVGGDGTANEVANGILNSRHSNNTVLGIVSAGTACSFARSLGITHHYTRDCALLAGQSRALIDVGVIQCHSPRKKWKR